MRLYLALLSAMAFLSGAAPAYADHYEFDKGHTHIVFYVNHLGFSDMIGLFTAFSGGFDFDEKHPENSTVDVTLQPAGIRTTSETLDHVVQGENFFNSSKYPFIRFVSTSVKVTGDKTADVTGDLNMLGVTKPVTLHVQLNKADYEPIVNTFVAGFNAQASLKRSDFGMSYGIPLVGDEVRVDISTEGINQQRKKADSIKH